MADHLERGSVPSLLKARTVELEPLWNSLERTCRGLAVRILNHARCVHRRPEKTASLAKIFLDNKMSLLYNI